MMRPPEPGPRILECRSTPAVHPVGGGPPTPSSYVRPQPGVPQPIGLCRFWSDLVGRRAGEESPGPPGPGCGLLGRAAPPTRPPAPFPGRCKAPPGPGREAGAPRGPADAVPGRAATTRAVAPSYRIRCRRAWRLPRSGERPADTRDSRSRNGSCLVRTATAPEPLYARPSNFWSFSRSNPTTASPSIRATGVARNPSFTNSWSAA